MFQCTVSQLIDLLNSKLSVYLKHVFTISHQYKVLGLIKNNLNDNEIFIIIDFSQNYNLKYNREIQSVHFVASKKQASLQTRAFFYKNNVTGLECISFVSVSDCLRHDAAATWALLEPVFTYVKQHVPNFKSIHFQSDGPSTQYKNKTNFSLFNYYCAKHIHDLIKNDNCKAKSFLVSEFDVENIDKIIPLDLKAVKDTTLVHQVVWVDSKKDSLPFRYLSCYVCKIENCIHHSLNIVN